MESKTIKSLKKLFENLPSRRYLDFFFVMSASVLQGLMDVGLVALIARLVSLMAGGDLPDQIPGIRVFGENMLDQASWLLLVTVSAFWITSAIRFVVALLQSRLSADIWVDLTNKAYSNLITQDYEFHVHNKASNIFESFNRILAKVTDMVLYPIVSIASNSLSVLILLVGVVALLGMPALLMFGLMFFAYIGSSSVISKYLKFSIKQNLRHSKKILFFLMESITSIRDVHLYSSHQYFIDKITENGSRAKYHDRLTKLLPDVPRYVIEPAGVTVLLIIGLLPSILSGDSSRLNEAMPLLAAVLATLLRLTAPLTNAFRNFNKLRGCQPEINDILRLLDLKPNKHIHSFSDKLITPKGLMPSRFIQLKDLTFTYVGSDTSVLNKINMSIPVGSRIALVGRSGSGKTTLAHLLLGLLRPCSGNVMLDGIPLKNSEISSWQKNCAFVPQDIHLMDASIKENIAFGCTFDEIDDNLVWSALKAAQLSELVAEMPYGLLTLIGENGVKLSGGQRQRLSLARAFYKGSSVLILDEATSALDNKTEQDVLQAINIIGRQCTIIVIAHRLATIRKCDLVYELENKKIKAYGTYDSLLQKSTSFSELVQMELSK